MTEPGASGSLVGQIIADRYRIDKKLGGGGMGEVYLGEHVRMGRKVAVKVLRAALSDDQDSLLRFENEAKNASLISHPNVAQVYDFGEHEKMLYICMEFIEGESMQGVMERDGVMHPDMVADVIMQSASALAAAHERHVLHRDVKPDNIMLAKNPDGTYLVKLVDFGIARAMLSTDKRVTQTGMVVGTPEFMSPEQIAGEALDQRSDLYSLALVAFIGLTGDTAFPSTGSMESLILRLTSRPRTLVEVRQSVTWPPRLQEVFDKALAPNKEERHPTAVDFASDLSSAIITMSPSETQAFYRRALEARSVNPVALTPSATPVKATQEKTRKNKGATKEQTVAATAAAPSAEPRGLVNPRKSQNKYEPSTRGRTSPLRAAILLAVIIGGIAYFDDNGVVAKKFDGWGVPAVTTAFNQIRKWGNKRQLDGSSAAAPSASETPAAASRPKTSKPKAISAPKPDSTPAAGTVTPPKTDSSAGTLVPPALSELAQ